MNPVSDVSRFYAAGNVKMRLQSKCRSMEIFTEQFSILSHVALLASNTKKKEKLLAPSKVKCFWVDTAKWGEGMTFCTHIL